MTHGQSVLNLLLDRYERSGHCLPGKTSNRRVALSLKRGEYAYYRENDPKVTEINDELAALATQGLVTLSWRKGYEGWLLENIYLELDRLSEAYAQANRSPLTDTAATLLDVVCKAMVEMKTPWKRSFLEAEAAQLQEKLRPSRLLPEDRVQAEAVLKVLQYTERGAELMRVISTNCFHDSKFLERNLLSQLVAIAKAYEPDLVSYRTLGEDILTQSVVLEQIGILTYPEIFELCGDVQFNLSGTTIGTAPFQRGFCLHSENLGKVSTIDLAQINTVLFIENRTNYRHLVLNGVPEDTLIIHHGGFYSPAKGELFRLLASCLVPSTKILFWGDIDLGGFLMFTRLKKNFFPTLLPWRMDLDEYQAHKSFGVERSSNYLKTLQQRMDACHIDEAFYPVVQVILKSGITVEQEIML